MSREFNGNHGGHGGYSKGPRQDGYNGKGGRPGGDRKPHGGKPRGGKPYGDRSKGAGRPYGDRSKGDGRSYDDRNNSNAKPYGDRGDRKFNKGPRGSKGFGKRHEGGRFDGPPRERLHVDRGGRPGQKPFGKNAPYEPKKGNSDLLKATLERIAGKAFGSYRETQGSYAFDAYELRITHVQRDPFAPASQIEVRLDQEMAGFDPQLFDTPWKRVAIEDRILRAFGAEIAKNSFDFADFIKGGAFSVSRPGPQILERSACSLTEDSLTVRFEATFPARDRAIATREFETMFFDVLPRIVRDSLLAVSYPEGELQTVADLADDQHALREALVQKKLVAFVADGAILPRETGVSQRPLPDAVPFTSPESLRVSINTPHAGTIQGMGVPAGVTLVVGGGYHGKSTLLQAIQEGVYDHIAGDGREYVVCDATAVKLRAEDGRSVRGTDISLFINNLPSGTATESFWTDNASGSTSQAASTAEAMEAGSRLFLIDEDTSATNFMVREPLMQKVIARDGEPITPFVERLRDLYEKADISTILVAGSSGAFFMVADTVIQMKEYEPLDITGMVKKACAEEGAVEVPRALGFKRPNADRILVPPQHPLTITTSSEARKADRERREGRGQKGPERLRAKVLGGVDIRVGSTGSDMRFVEQMVDAEQAKALALIVKACLERDLLSRMSVREAVDTMMNEIGENGLTSLQGDRAEGGIAMPRREEAFACLNRLRPRD